MVEQSINSVPCRACGAMSFHADSTCSPPGSMVMTTSAPSTVPRALAAICTPSRADVSREPGTRSKPRTWPPVLMRLAAIGPPILPRPMNPIAAMFVSSLVIELQFQCADRFEVPIDNIRCDSFELVRSPVRIAVLVDDRRADAFDEIMSGDAGERNTVILLEALLNALEGRRVTHVAQCDF